MQVKCIKSIAYGDKPPLVTWPFLICPIISL